MTGPVPQPADDRSGLVAMLIALGSTLVGIGALAWVHADPGAPWFVSVLQWLIIVPFAYLALCGVGYNQERRP